MTNVDICVRNARLRRGADDLVDIAVARVDCDTISMSAVIAAISSERHRRDSLHGWHTQQPTQRAELKLW
jgi:hypothetical protein